MNLVTVFNLPSADAVNTLAQALPADHPAAGPLAIAAQQLHLVNGA